MDVVQAASSAAAPTEAVAWAIRAVLHATKSWAVSSARRHKGRNVRFLPLLWLLAAIKVLHTLISRRLGIRRNDSSGRIVQPPSTPVARVLWSCGPATPGLFARVLGTSKPASNAGTAAPSTLSRPRLNETKDIVLRLKDGEQASILRKLAGLRGSGALGEGADVLLVALPARFEVKKTSRGGG